MRSATVNLWLVALSHLSHWQLISGLDITRGDERKVGYYAGLIVSTTSASFDALQWFIHSLGVTFLCNGSNHGPSLESNVGLHRPQTGTTDRFVRIGSIDALFWIFSHLLGLGLEVSLLGALNVPCYSYNLVHRISRSLCGLLNGNIGNYTCPKLLLWVSQRLHRCHKKRCRWSHGCD